MNSAISNTIDWIILFDLLLCKYVMKLEFKSNYVIEWNNLELIWWLKCNMKWIEE